MTTLHQTVVLGPLALPGDLLLPAGAAGLVIFAHGSSSHHRSGRNRAVAQDLQRRRIGTLLFDLLTPQEAQQHDHKFDIELLAQRLLLALDWVRALPAALSLPLGLYGASTGAAAALQAAATLGSAVTVVVSRGGRPDLAGAALAQVSAPTLLIVGGEDHVVIDLNRQAYTHLHGEKQLVIVPGATHLFEEPGTLEEVARLASQWFATHLKRPLTER